MAYKNAKDYLPEELLCEIQKYIQGVLIYIPTDESNRNGWGKLSGTRKELDKRNASIRKDFKSGLSIGEIADKYYLSVDSIRKIVYNKKKQLC